jgi:glutathione S-transferase
LVCEEPRIASVLKRYERGPQGISAPPEYKALHPVGAAPVITDGDFVLAESGAIMEYIIRKYGGGQLIVSPDQPNFADYLYWFHFANATFMATQLVVGFQRMAAPPQGVPEFLVQREESLWHLVDDRLGKTPYFAGYAFTAADIIMGFPLTTIRAFMPRDLSAFSNIRAYLKRIGERPAYRRAMEKGDPQMKPLLS